MERKVYCDYLRLFATFAVVIAHVAAVNWYSGDVNQWRWQVLNLYDSVLRWSVPVFVMLSGALFLNREISIKDLYCKYILRLVIALFTWNVFYALINSDSFEKGILTSVKLHMNDLVYGHHHMWFVYMIMGIYICIPIYKKIVLDQKVMKYFLLVSFVVFLLIPWTTQVLNHFIVGNYGLVGKLVHVVQVYLSNLKLLHKVLRYSFYFVLGYYLDTIELKKSQRNIIYVLGAIGFILTIMLTSGISLKLQNPNETYYTPFTVNVFLESICVYTWFKYREYKSEKLNEVVSKMSKYTFGIYVTHMFFIENLNSVFNLHSLSFFPVVSVPVISMLVFVCALVVSATLNHIPIIKKYCV